MQGTSAAAESVMSAFVTEPWKEKLASPEQNLVTHDQPLDGQCNRHPGMGR